MSDATNWPDWTDEATWELGPDPEDAQWVAENLNSDWDADEPTPDEVLDDDVIA